VKLDLERDGHINKALKDVNKQVDKRAGEIKDLWKEMRESLQGIRKMTEMLEGQIDVLNEDAATFQVQLDSLAEKVCHCVDRIVLVQEHKPDTVFFNPCADLLSSAGTNHSSWVPSELEYVTPPLGMIMPLHPVSNNEMGDVASSSHWGRGVLETSGNILGTL